MSLRARSAPLVFVGAIEDVAEEDVPQGHFGLIWWERVVIYLGDQEVARITGEDLVTSDGRIIIDETVARWLARRLT